MINENANIKKKLYSRTERDAKTGCHIWQGKSDNGYGRIRYKNKDLYTHRLSWAIHHGEITNGDVVHHKCANKLCLNVKHLQLVSSIDNNAEMQGRMFYERKIKELEKRLEACNCEQTKATGN